MKKIAKSYVGSRTPAEKWLHSLLEDITESKQTIPKSQKDKFFILQSNTDFLLRMADIRTKFGLFTKTFKDHWEWAENLYKSKMAGETKSDFDKKLQKLLYDFNIGERWQRAIEYYIILNKPPQNLIPPALDFWVDSNFNSILIKINRSTTLEDIKETWKEIEKNKDALKVFSEKYETSNNARIMKFIKPKKQTTIKEFKKYKKAHQLKEAGHSYKEIAVKLGLSESDYPQIGIFINRFKQAIKENELY